VEAKELSRVVGDNAAGIPSLLSGQRKIYKPKRRLYGLACESLSTFTNSSFHMRSLQLVLKTVLPDTRAGVIFR
jgi:hypothetical protein